MDSSPLQRATTRPTKSDAAKMAPITKMPHPKFSSLYFLTPRISPSVKPYRMLRQMSELLSTLDPRRTAFLTLDIQTALVGFYAKQAADFMRAVTSLLACARILNATVIHVKVGFRPGFPEVSERNRLFSSFTKNPEYAKMLNTEWLNLHPALEARPDEPVLTKPRISAFEGTGTENCTKSGR